MFDSSYLVITLKEKCKEYKISYQGTKAQLIKMMVLRIVLVVVQIIKRFGKRSSLFILTTKENEVLISSDYINKNYSKVKGLNFDLLMEYNDKIKIIDFNTDNWATSKCSCWFYLKNYHCYHLISIAVNQNLLTIPKRYIKTAIEPKKKAGRIDKAKQALKKQN